MESGKLRIFNIFCGFGVVRSYGCGVIGLCDYEVVRLWGCAVMGLCGYGVGSSVGFAIISGCKSDGTGMTDWE